VIGVVGTTENMPGRGLQPGDVVRAASGKTIEVINTDAEGASCWPTRSTMPRA
jgi:leucyl aminopeptidase